MHTDDLSAEEVVARRDVTGDIEGEVTAVVLDDGQQQERLDSRCDPRSGLQSPSTPAYSKERIVSFLQWLYHIESAITDGLSTTIQR